MAILRIDEFGGIAPLVDPKKLPAWAAQDAENCMFDGGDLRPVMGNITLSWPGGAPATSNRIYQWKERWLSWAGDVDVVRSPVVNDQWERLYWTRGGALTARFAINNTIQANVDMTALGLDLGVPGPSAAPTVDAIDSDIPSVEATEIANTSPARVSTAVDHPFGAGQRVVVSLAKAPSAPPNTPDTPPDRTGMVEINGGTFVTKLVENASGQPDKRVFDLIGAQAADWSDYDRDRWRATITRVFTDSDMDSRSYVYTYVSPYGEESQPSPPSDVVDVVRGSAVRVRPAVTPTQISQAWRVRLYRSVTGTAGTNFFFIKEQPATQNMVITDDIADAAIGELLPSETWAPPPVGLSGLTAMPNGFLAGFVGNVLYFSEPYQPHAWPRQYSRTMKDDVVALEVYGQTLVVATKGKPYIGTGTDPASVSLSQLDAYAPCLSKPCTVSTGTGVIWPSYDGLVHASAAGVQILTQRQFSKRNWASIWSGLARAAAWHDGRYIASIGNAGWIFEPIGERVNVSTVTASGFPIGAMAVSTTQVGSVPRDTLMMARAITPAVLVAFDVHTANPQTALWRGRIITLPRPVSLACGQVYAESYPVTIVVHAARVQASGQPGSLIWPAGDLSPQTITVTGPEPFRLAGGFMAREWRIDVAATRRVQSVILASSMTEIAQV